MYGDLCTPDCVIEGVIPPLIMVIEHHCNNDDAFASMTENHHTINHPVDELTVDVAAMLPHVVVS